MLMLRCVLSTVLSLIVLRPYPDKHARSVQRRSKVRQSHEEDKNACSK